MFWCGFYGTTVNFMANNLCVCKKCSNFAPESILEGICPRFRVDFDILNSVY